MAKDDRTEKPTQKRKDEARKQGQVARSADLGGAGVLLAGLIGVLIVGNTFMTATGGAMESIFSQIARPHNVISGAGLHGLMNLVLMTLLKTVGPVLGITLVAGIALNVLQVGLHFSTESLKPKFSKLNPINGVKNLFNVSKVFDLGKDLAKVAVIGGIVAMVLVPDLTSLGAGVGTTPAALGALISSNVKGIALRAAAAYMVIGLVDFFWQRYRTGKNLMMTKEEVKEETKQRDLPPEVKRAIRRRQFQAARARMMAAVPRADVVVTNPTHFAVALEYGGDSPAPVVVAKGQDHIAFQIRRIAEENGVPIVPDPPLARELYRTVEIDEMIPGDLYAAVAQVLAFVYRVAARKRVGV